MPPLALPFVLMLTGVFAAGGFIAWYITERKGEGRRSQLEASMREVLQERYRAYQEIEAGMQRVISRLDQLETRASERREPVEPEHTLMRVENTELWDLEKTFERRQAEQLAEITEKSQRVVELMETIEALEPMVDELEERNREREHYEQGLRERDEAHREREIELRGLISELEPHREEVEELSSRMEIVEAERDDWQQRHDALAQIGAEEVTSLRQQLKEHEQIVAQLAECEERIEELVMSGGELESELTAVKSEVLERDELLEVSEQEICDVREELSRVTAERDGKVAELDAHGQKLNDLESNWKSASGKVAMQRSKLAEHLSSFEAAQGMLSQLKPLIEQLETNLKADDIEVHEVEDLEGPAAALPAQPEEAMVEEMFEKTFGSMMEDGEPPVADPES